MTQLFFFQAYINQEIEIRDYENIPKTTDQSQPPPYIEIIW